MADRWSDADDYKGTRTKGRRIATIWWSKSDEEADITVTATFDGMDPYAQIEALEDAISMLNRQLRVCQRNAEKDFGEFLKLLGKTNGTA
jgi:hypothetical protein